MSVIKRGTEITPNRFQDLIVRIFKNLNEIPSSNIVVSTKQFKDFKNSGDNSVIVKMVDFGAYADSIPKTGGLFYLSKYYDYVKRLKEM